MFELVREVPYFDAPMTVGIVGVDVVDEICTRVLEVSATEAHQRKEHNAITVLFTLSASLLLFSPVTTTARKREENSAERVHEHSTDWGDVLSRAREW